VAGYVAIFNMTGSQLQSRLNGPSLSPLPPLPADPSAPPSILVKRVRGVPSTPVFGSSNTFAALFPQAGPPEISYSVPIEIDAKRFPLDENLQLYVTYGAVALSAAGVVAWWEWVPAPPVPTTTG
jgi:hypothetical protein